MSLSSCFQVININVVLLLMSNALLILTLVNLLLWVCFAWWWRHPLGDATDIRYQELTNCDLQMVSVTLLLDSIFILTSLSCFCPCYCYLISYMSSSCPCPFCPFFSGDKFWYFFLPWDWNPFMGGKRKFLSSLSFYGWEMSSVGSCMLLLYNFVFVLVLLNAHVHFVLFPPNLFMGGRRVQSKAVCSGGSAGKPSQRPIQWCVSHIY